MSVRQHLDQHLGALDNWLSGLWNSSLGAYPADSSEFSNFPDFWDADDLALGVEDHPCVWTDKSRGTVTHLWF